MKAKAYITKCINIVESRNDVVWSVYPLHYKAWIFKLLKIQSKNITPKDKVMLITSWIHGEEIAGPLSLLSYLNRIITLIHHHGYKVIIYPLTNPSGFEHGTRMNIDDDSWTCGNNDFLRYLLPNGNIVDEIGEKQKHTKRYRSSDPILKQKLPVETLMLHKCLKQDVCNYIVVSIDLHQDYIKKELWICAYQYSFGDFILYDPIIHELEKYIPLLSNSMINSWFMVQEHTVTNDHWFIIRHDGSITDLMWRLGVPYTVAVETTGQTPLPLAKKINRLWIKWLVLLLDHDKTWWQKNHSSSKYEPKKKRC